MGAPASLCPAPFFFLWIAQSFVISAENSIVDSTYICGQSTPLLGSLSPGMADEGGEMVRNLETAQTEASCSATGSPAAAPSCYRVSVVSGSLEVSARLKNADDLELLLKVLEANRGLFPKVERAATETVVKATKTADRPETGFAKADKETKTSAKLDRLGNGILTP
jgi:hypothetical protein